MKAVNYLQNVYIPAELINMCKNVIVLDSRKPKASLSTARYNLHINLVKVENERVLYFLFQYTFPKVPRNSDLPAYLLGNYHLVNTGNRMFPAVSLIHIT